MCLCVCGMCRRTFLCWYMWQSEVGVGVSFLSDSHLICFETQSVSHFFWHRYSFIHVDSVNNPFTYIHTLICMCTHPHRHTHTEDTCAHAHTQTQTHTPPQYVACCMLRGCTAAVVSSLRALRQWLLYAKDVQLWVATCFKFRGGPWGTGLVATSNKRQKETPQAGQ